MSEPDLDAPIAEGADPRGIMATAMASVEHFDAARADAEGFEVPYPPDAIRNVVVCGMGGSAVAADLVAGAYADRLRVPMATVRDYGLPGWVGPDTLVVLSSYSGTTEETLTCAMDATDRGALCVGLSSGGKITEEYGRRDGVPVFPLPGGLQPRAAILRSLVPLAMILSKAGVLPPIDEDLAEARETVAAAVAAMGPGVPEASNPAKQLARVLHGHVPVVWGGELTAAVAHRWRCQINENAKLPAVSLVIPELDHNDICGYEGMPAVGMDAWIVMLRDRRQHRQVQRRLDLTREVVEPHVAGVSDVTADGESPLARMLDLVMVGDMASIYMAFLHGVDPGAIDAIDRLKAGLATAPYGRTATSD